jgi:hypothetical protein
MNDLQVPAIENVPNAATEDSTWWDQNRDAVEAKFIGMLIAETTRKPYTGPERRSRGTVVLDPADVAIAQAQAKRLGIAYEEHSRRLFHLAVQAEEQRRVL